MVVALRTRPKEQKVFFEWKDFMVKKNRRNNFFYFVLKRKIKHKDTWAVWGGITLGTHGNGHGPHHQERSSP